MVENKCVTKGVRVEECPRRKEPGTFGAPPPKRAWHFLHGHLAPQDRFAVADVRSREPSSPVVNAEDFVRRGPAPLIQLGKALFGSRVRLSSIENGEPIVWGDGNEAPQARWSPMPADPGIICHLRSRGLVWLETSDQQEIIGLLHQFLMDVARHNQLAGIEESENIAELPPLYGESSRFVNWQRNDRIQYLSYVGVRRLPNGYAYTQQTIHESAVLDQYKWAYQRSTLPSDHIHYSGQIQVLEVQGGVAIVIEMEADSSNIHAPSCGIAADSGLLNVLSKVGITDDPKRAVKQRIEDRLKTLSELARR